ncbi:ATPase [Novosphingobium tardum]|uniref:ATPase n=1 Tax=Novosphingobium tardum TaxID=1538021 RepID=A0ABV8RPR6_9SPHN
MSQIALPLILRDRGAQGPARIIVGPSNSAAIDLLSRGADWPFRTAVLTGPPRAGKSLLARWFAESAMGEAIDDADAMAEDALFHAWNRAQASETPLLFVSSRGPGEWRIALPDLASRLGAALLIELGAPDDEMLAALIEDHAARRGVALGEGALAWLLPRIDRTYAAAERVVGEIDRLSLERKAPVTISLMRDAMAGNGGEWQPRLL